MNKIILHIILITAGILPAVSICAQADSLTSEQELQNERRFKRVALGSSIIYSVGLIGLNQLWYADYNKSPLHSFNDNKEWKQVDKIGHAYSAYTLTKLSSELYPKNYNTKKKLIYSGASAFLFLGVIEVFDGYSEEWGFSWGDFIANTTGVGLYVGQELLFKKQVMTLKYSYQNTGFRKLRPNTFGENTLRSAFKDYNGQTYWASFNLNSISKKVKPTWLNIAFGYGAGGMIFAQPEVVNFEGVNYKQQREYYLSLDVDWSKIHTNNPYVEWLLKVVNCIKIPAPTLRFKDGGEPVFYGLYF